MTYELHSCAMLGRLERIEQFIEGGASIAFLEQGGSTPLLFACLVGNFEIDILGSCYKKGPSK
jgi:ankyrin repeat protein